MAAQAACVSPFFQNILFPHRILGRPSLRADPQKAFRPGCCFQDRLRQGHTRIRKDIPTFPSQNLRSRICTPAPSKAPSLKPAVVWTYASYIEEAVEKVKRAGGGIAISGFGYPFAEHSRIRQVFRRTVYSFRRKQPVKEEHKPARMGRRMLIYFTDKEKWDAV